MATDNMGNIFNNNVIDPNQRIAINNAQIQRNNAQINSLGNGNVGYMPPIGYNNNGFINNGYGGQYQPQPQFLKCRPVTSIEEARAAQIDLDGSLWVFTDIGHGKIYTKQIHNDGSSAFGVYTYTEETPVDYNSANHFVTKEEMNNTVQGAIQYILNMLPKQQETQSSQQSASAADNKNNKALPNIF